MKSLIWLLERVLQDCSTSCNTSTTRDLLLVSRRVKHEGLSFLTITLGDFASDFERSLELGHIEPKFFLSFKKNGLIPKFLSGIVRLVFDGDGKLLNEPNITAIFYVRQICRMWKKIELPCSEERNLAAINGYIKVEQDLSMLNFADENQDHFYDFGKISDIIWSDVLASVEKSIAAFHHIPKHGPGATATKVLPNQKYSWKQWHERLEPYFPSDSFCYSSSEIFLEESSKIDFVIPEREQPVRVVFVPKTLKTPRVIGIEPVCMQYTQQSLLSIIVPCLEKHHKTIGHVNFQKQSINAQLALKSSHDGLLATMDLSEASDRVLNALVERMLASVPLVRDAIQACRSTSATLPTGQTIQLVKFASMGSALCFPIESMVFYTILIAREIRRLRLPLKSRSIDIVKKNVYVYGDDLILPVDGVLSATLGLQALGLKVNSNKTFSTGKFRESCGIQPNHREDVTTVFLRRLPPSGRRDVRSVVSLVAMSNLCVDKHMFHTAMGIKDLITKLGFDIPYANENAAYVGYKWGFPATIHRRNDDLQRPEVKAFVLVPRKQRDQITGHSALMKWFLQGLNPDVTHYDQSVGTGTLALKSRWSAVR